MATIWGLGNLVFRSPYVGRDSVHMAATYRGTFIRVDVNPETMASDSCFQALTLGTRYLRMRQLRQCPEILVVTTLTQCCLIQTIVRVQSIFNDIYRTFRSAQVSYNQLQISPSYRLNE